MELLWHPMILPIAFPLAAGLLCLLLPERLERTRAAFAVAASAANLLAVGRLLLAWKRLPGDGPLFWTGGAGADLRLDHLAAFILLAIAAFGFLVALYSTAYMRGRERLREYYAYLLWTVALSCGAILANNLLLLLACWGMLGFTLYAMIGIAGPDAAQAARKTLVIVGGSDCLLMLGVAVVWVLSGTLEMGAIRLELAGGLHYAAFLCFTVAALAKAGAMPFHSWLPDCGEKAPVSVVAFLPASLDKLLGIYLLVRLVKGLFVMNPLMNGLLMLVGAGTIICAVMMALVQHDLKRLLSYHAVSQVGYMILGIGTGTVLGIAAGLFHMLNHAMYKSTLFLCAGAVEKQAGHTDLDRLGGLARAMPVTFGAFLVAALSISGIPPLNGFYSKWMIYQSLVESGRPGTILWVIFLATALFGSALTLASFVKVLHAVFLCKPSPHLAHRHAREVSPSMWLPSAGLAGLCLLFGVFAWQWPLPAMIFPAVGGAVPLPGSWSAGLATVLLLAAYALGALIYLLSAAWKGRACATYIGGEILKNTYISGAPGGRSNDLEVTGVDFYRTVEDLPLLRQLYAAAGRKWFDLYDVGGRAIHFVAGILRFAHNGLLPMYLTWVLAGLLLLLWILFFGGRAAL